MLKILVPQFGRVLRGMRVVERLGAVDVDADDRPKETVRIMKSRVQSLEDDSI